MKTNLKTLKGKAHGTYSIGDLVIDVSDLEAFEAELKISDTEAERILNLAEKEFALVSEARRIENDMSLRDAYLDAFLVGYRRRTEEVLGESE